MHTHTHTHTQVEVWLNRLLETMQSTIRHEMTDAVVSYEEKPRDQWLFEPPAQVRNSLIFISKGTARPLNIPTHSTALLAAILSWLAACRLLTPGVFLILVSLTSLCLHCLSFSVSWTRNFARQLTVRSCTSIQISHQVSQSSHMTTMYMT